MPNRFTDWSDSAFGIEVELADYVDYRSLHGVLFPIIQSKNVLNRFIGERTYFHSSGNTFDLKTDSSCGFELVSPRLTWRHDDLNTFYLLLQTLEVWQNTLNLTLTDNRCSVHVHHDIRHFTHAHIRKLMQLWYAFEPLAFSLVKSHRITSSYCQPLRVLANPNRDFAGYRRIMAHSRRIGRRIALNLANYRNRRAIEVRIHHGETDPVEIMNWTKWTQTMMMLATRRLRLNSLNRALNSAPDEQADSYSRLLYNFFDRNLADEVTTWMHERQANMNVRLPVWMLNAEELDSTRRITPRSRVVASTADWASGRVIDSSRVMNGGQIADWISSSYIEWVPDSDEGEL